MQTIEMCGNCWLETGKPECQGGCEDEPPRGLVALELEQTKTEKVKL